MKFIAESSTIDKLKEYTDKSTPSIADIENTKDRNTGWNNSRDNGHQVVVLFVDNNNSGITFMDPDCGMIRHLTFDHFPQRWHDQDPVACLIMIMQSLSSLLIELWTA